MWPGISSALFGEVASEEVHRTLVADLPKNGRGDFCGVPSMTDWCDELPEDPHAVETHQRATDAHVAEFEAMLAEHYSIAFEQEAGTYGSDVSTVMTDTAPVVPLRHAVASHGDVERRQEGDGEPWQPHWESFRSPRQMCEDGKVHEATPRTTDEESCPSSLRSPSCSSVASASHVAANMKEEQSQEPPRRVNDNRLPHSSVAPLSPKLRRFRAAVHLASTVDAMLSDVRSRQTEQLYDQNWLHLPANMCKQESLNSENPTAAQSPIEKWQQHRIFQLSSVAGGLLHQVRSKETETLYDSNWAELLSCTDSEENYTSQDVDHDTKDLIECETNDTIHSLAGSVTCKASGAAQGLSSRWMENFVDNDGCASFD